MVSGLELTAQALQHLDALVAAANGKRKSRLLTRDDVLATMAEARRTGVAHRNGGRATTSSMLTTVALAVRGEKTLTVGVGEGGAVTGSPARVKAWSGALSLKLTPEELKKWASQRDDDRLSVNLAPLEEPPSPSPSEEDDALLAQVLAHPEDDAPRRVLADEWSARGDPRGEFVSLQLANTAPERIAALLRAHETVWAAPLKKLVTGWQFRRGFVEHVQLKTKTFLEHAQALFSLAPIRSVELGGVSPALMPPLAAMPELQRLHTLTLGAHKSGGEELKAQGLASFLESPHLGTLRDLGLWNQTVGPDGGRALAASELKVHTLRLFGNRLGAKGVAPLSALRTLRSLDVRYNELKDAGAIALADSGFSSLQALDVSYNGITSKGVDALTRLRGLKRLVLSDNAIGNAGLENVMSTLAPVELELGNCGLTPLGIEVLAESPHASKLKLLDLSANAVGEEGAQALLRSKHLSNLRTLRCAAKGIEPKTLKQLSERFGREASRG